MLMNPNKFKLRKHQQDDNYELKLDNEFTKQILINKNSEIASEDATP